MLHPASPPLPSSSSSDHPSPPDSAPPPPPFRCHRFDVVDVEDPEDSDAEGEAEDEDLDPASVRSEEDVQFDKIYDAFEEQVSGQPKLNI